MKIELINEDCLKAMKSIKSQSVDMILCDLPYKVTGCEWDTQFYKEKANESIQQFTNYPKQLIKFNTETKREHPTQKPVNLLEYLIKTYTKEKEVIMDNCMGSGSTGVAAIKANRSFIGIEMDTNYYKIAQRRIAEISKWKRSKA